MTINSFLRMMPFVTSAIIYLLMVCHAMGDPDIPPVPRLGTAPGSYSWTIEYQYKTPNNLYASPPDPSVAAIYARLRKQTSRLTSVQVTKAGDRRREVRQFDNGTQTINWIIGDLLIVEDVSNNTYSIMNGKDPLTPPFKHDFESLGWVDKAQYKGHQSYQGITCCVYDAGEIAYIDAKTGLPVAIQSGDITLLYTYKPSNEAVELPPKGAAQMKIYSGAL